MVMKKDRKKGRRGRRQKSEFDQQLLDLARVTRVVKGGRRFRFRATMVIGNRKGKVGVGVSKGSDVSIAIQKAVADAKKNMIDVNLDGKTIAYDVLQKLASAKVMLRPAKEGKGIIAGGAVRTVVELAGVKDIVSKSYGTSNKLNVARATIEALKTLKKTDNGGTDEVVENGRKKMAGVVRIVNDIGNESTEFAIVIADPWHNQGLGGKMTDLILDIARKKGIKKVYAVVLKANNTMIQMFKRRNFVMKRMDLQTFRAELIL